MKEKPFAFFAFTVLKHLNLLFTKWFETFYCDPGKRDHYFLILIFPFILKEALDSIYSLLFKEDPLASLSNGFTWFWDTSEEKKLTFKVRLVLSYILLVWAWLSLMMFRRVLGQQLN